MRTIPCAALVAGLWLAHGRAEPPISSAERKEILALLTGDNDRAGHDKLVARGPRVLPVLLEVATAAESRAFERSRVFRVVWRMNVPKDEFVAVAVKSLSTDSGLFATAALALVAQSGDGKHAPEVCGMLLRMAKQSDPEDLFASSSVVKAMVALGTDEELKRIEQWLADNPLRKDLSAAAAKRFGEGRAVTAEAAKQLRAKLKK